ncbi:PAS domain S-box protein [Kovacikia minuta CCNUW1]|uniref:PAS domain S-box protein n=1 Tax=Kovacikia minuta TaxID=2931930 RepID=UPI001CCC83CF|nr:PAS domain S-box protein [Kovacikia minuta]UBF28337.1 PAS domain S-box protein [Kovacikia minuta CCNUW1]
MVHLSFLAAIPAIVGSSICSVVSIASFPAASNSENGIRLGLCLLGMGMGSLLHGIWQHTQRDFVKQNHPISDNEPDSRQTEASLRQYERIISTTPDGVAVVDRTYTYQLVNQTYLDRTQKQREEIVGHTVSEVMGEIPFKEVIQSQLDLCLTGETIRYEEWFNFADGQRHFVSVTYAPYIELDGTVSGVVVTTRDLTDLKQAEAKLEESRAFLNQVINVISNTIFVKDEQHRFVLVNQSVCDLTGIPQEAFLGRTDYDFFPKKQADHFRRKDEQVFQTGLEDITEEPLTSLDGETYWLLTKKACFQNQHGQKFLVGSSQDITERKRTEQVLKDSEERFRLLIQNVDVGIILAGSRTEILTCNQMALELVGLTEAELLHRTALDPNWNAVHEDGSSFEPRTLPIPQAIATQQPVRNVVMGVPRPARGDFIWLLVSAVPQLDSDGTIRFVICSFNDITARKQAEISLQHRTLQEQAFSRIIQTIRNSLDLDTIFSTAVREFAELLQTNAAGISQYLPERQCWLCIAEHLRVPESFPILGTEIPDQNNPITQRLRQGESVVIIEETQVLDDPINLELTKRMSSIPVRLLAIPLEVDGAIWGSLGGSKSSPASFTESEIHLARRFADQLEVAIQQAFLYQQVHQLNQTLEQHVRERTAELQKSRDLFEAIFQESADAIFLVDTDSFLILDCNQRAVELFEADNKAWLIGIRGHSLHKEPWTTKEMTRVRQEFKIQGIWSQEIEYRTLKGHDFWGSLVSKQIQIAERQMHLVRITDISDRKAAEAALRQSEARFQHLAANIPGIFYQSVIQADGSRQFHYISSGFQRIFELEPAQLLENADIFWTMVHPDDVEPLRAEVIRTLTNREPFHFEYRILTPSGSIKWIHNAASRQYLANGDVVSDGVVLDITDRKQAEVALQTSETLFRTLIEELQVGVVLYNPDATPILFNSKMLELGEVTPEELAHSSLLDPNLDVIREDGSPFPIDEYPALVAVSTRQPVLDVVMGLYRPVTQSRVWLLISAQPLLNEQGSVKQVICTASDITDLKRAEFQLQRQAESDQLLASIAQTINQSVCLDEVLKTCLEQLREFLQCDRVLVCRFNATHNAACDVVIELEAISQPELSLLGQTIHDPCFGQDWAARHHQGYITVQHDTQTEDLAPCYLEFLTQMQVRASLVVAILQADRIWGLLVVHQCHAPRQWQAFEVDLLKQLGLQIGIASQKASLYTQLETELVERRRAEQALAQQVQREQVLRIISQQIRKSLKLENILATTVSEVRQLLNTDRALIFQLFPDGSGVVIKESVGPEYPTTEGMRFLDEHFPSDCYEFYRKGQARAISDTALDLWADCLVEFMQQVSVKSKIVAPILQKLEDGTTIIWGLLIVHACTHHRQWQTIEVDLLQQLATQVGIAIQQANLYQELKNQLGQREVLLKEVHHRVKNNLQVISSMLWLQAKAAKHATVFDALADTRSRLQAMALIHETLYESSDLGKLNFHDYIKRLAANILAANSTASSQINLVCRLQPTLLNLETAIPCGLLLNELVTNAVKHGFPNQQKGEICITLEEIISPETESSPQLPLISEVGSPTQNLERHSPARYALTVQDNGVGIPDNLDLKQLKSLGLKIAYDLALQLRGNLELERTNGTRFQLTFSALEYRKRF